METHLKGDQQMAVDKTNIWLQEPHGGMFLLQGPAGVGKSFLTDYIIGQYKYPSKVVAAAPTNKAVRILQKFIHSKVKFSTIHAILGLREHIDSYGNQTFKRDYSIPAKLDQYHFLILDEVSMLSDDIFYELITFAENGMKILFIGDALQIPPVGNTDSMPFQRSVQEEFDIKAVSMDKIIRQGEGSPIIENSFQIRLNIHRPVPIALKKTMQNKQGRVMYLSENKLENLFNITILPIFNSPLFARDSDYIKVVAWRNKTVNKYNDIIRKSIFSESIEPRGVLPKIMIGEKLIADKPVITPEKQVIISTNEEMTVISYTIETEELSDDWLLKYYNTKVKVEKSRDAYDEFVIRILHEDSEELYEKIVNMYKVDALSKKQGSFEARSAWVDYYTFQKKFNPVKYNYCITAHKSQGSTYHTTVVMEFDMDSNRKTYEKNRILYTACTRPTTVLYVVH